MKLMGECIFKLLFGLCRINIKENCRICPDLKDKAVLSGFDDWIDLGADMSIFRKISQSTLCRVARTYLFPQLECFCERLRIRRNFIRENERLELLVSKRALH